ncbi:MAG TPA: hypothetical protein VMT39_03485 [Candidatus Bathyarchaeia archaeon]|nr:hypothetical protein [Candidatus Bathyarchaeia archaeon]
MRLAKQNVALSENHGMGRTDVCTGGLLTGREPLLAELALHDLGVECIPVELGNLVRTGDPAIAAADALLRRPRDDAGDPVFLQRMEEARRHTERIDAVHALALDEGEGAAFTVLWFVELYDVPGKRI